MWCESGYCVRYVVLEQGHDDGNAVHILWYGNVHTNRYRLYPHRYEWCSVWGGDADWGWVAYEVMCAEPVHDWCCGCGAAEDLGTELGDEGCPVGGAWFDTRKLKPIGDFHDRAHGCWLGSDGGCGKIGRNGQLWLTATTGADIILEEVESLFTEREGGSLCQGHNGATGC